MRWGERAVLVLLAHASAAVALQGQVIASADTTQREVRGNAVVDTLLLEIRLDGFGQQLAKAITVDGAILIPTRPVAELTGTIALPRERYLTLPSLRNWLGTDVRYDAVDLVVAITPVPSMPAVARATRDTERARLTKSTFVAENLILSPAAAGVLAIDYDVFGNSSSPGEPSYLVRAGLGVLGGELSSLLTSGGDPEIAWSLHRPGAPIVSRIQLGSSQTGSALSRAVHGISVGNAPFHRPAIVDIRTLGGRLPAGWTVDAYRGGRLYAFDSVGTDGRFAVPMPLNYGENTVDLLAYGPRGERVALQEFLRFSPGMLSRGQSEYAVTLGRCADDECRLAGSAHLRAGVNSAITIEGGVHYEQSNDQSLVAPFGSIIASPGRGVGAEVEVYRNEVTRASARFEPSALSGVEATWFNYPAATGQALLTGGRSLRVDAWSSLSTRPGLATVRAQWRHVPDPVSPRNEVTLGSNHAVGGMHLRPFTTTTFSPSSSSGASGLEVLASPSPRLPSWLQGTWLRGLTEVDHADGAVRRLEATLSRQVTRGLRLEGEWQWSAAQGKALAVRMVTHTPQVRAIARTSQRDGNRSMGWDYSAGGAVVVDARAKRVVLSSEPSVNRGGLHILTFLDTNADGVRQDDEPPVVGALVLVGSQALATDSAGRAYLWGVPSFEPLKIQIDSASVPPHWHVPPSLQLMLRNARTSRIELPIAPGSTLEGHVQLDGADPATIQLWLLNSRTRQQQQVELFRDGSFYVMSVRPGSYSLVARSLGSQVALREVPVDVPAANAPQQLAEVTIQLSGVQRSVVPPPRKQ